jgi:hypothetical protein
MSSSSLNETLFFLRLTDGPTNAELFELVVPISIS